MSGAKSGLGKRLVSALVMAPVALGAVWAGGVWFAALVWLAAGAMVWEWATLTAPGRAAILATLAAGVVVALAAHFLAPGTLAVGLGVAGSLVLYLLARALKLAAPAWTAVGCAYIALPSIALLWLRAAPDGAFLLIWLLLVIWATDTGAYFAGRAIGGPRLAPRFSPSKTWAGLIGGMACAGLIGGLAWSGFDLPGSATMHGLAGAALAVVAQLGDLFESAAKRRFGAKDSSSLIPGHGGVLDRVDGLLAAAPVVAVLILAQ